MLLFASLQLQVALQANVPQPKDEPEDDIESALNELQVATHLLLLLFLVLLLFFLRLLPLLHRSHWTADTRTGPRTSP
jgi:hypothetical protein